MEDSLLNTITQLLITLGPWIVFVIAALETAFFVGLLIPAEATVLLAGFLADTEYFELEHVLAATLLGALVGDQVGYLLGRLYGKRAVHSTGRIGRMWRRHEGRAIRLFRRRAIVAVSLARFISFVRTLMPWFAGMSRMPYGRFLFYDILGVTGWGVASVMAGYAAGRSWHILAEWLGSASVAIVIVAAIGFGLFTLKRRRLRAVHGRVRVRGLTRVGLTGNIASGKSAVADVWEALGATIVDADMLARVAVEPGSAGLGRVVNRFGEAILAPDGSLDRAALRSVVFEDEDARLDLEAIVHPEVERLRIEREHEIHAHGGRLVVHVIPLLFETGMEDAFDVLVLVDAPEEERLRRLIELRDLSETEARRMIAAQMPAGPKRARATIVIDNDGTLQDLEAKATATWHDIERRAAASA